MRPLILLAAIFGLSLNVFAQTDFSQENATVLLRHLAVDIGPRPMGSPAEHAALQYAAEKFREYGCDTAYVMPMIHTSKVNTTSGIAVGIKRGASGRMIVIGGHMDSAGPEIPGADDDGSGSAVVMECARILGKPSTQSTIVFCCFGGEEQGLEGSAYFVDHFPAIDSVSLMLQVDMANGLGVIDMDPDAGLGVSAPSWLPRAAAEEFSQLGYENLRYPTHFFSFNYARAAGSGSDHESFLQKGIPAIDFSTDVAKPIHTPRDNFENFDPRGLKRSGDLVLRLAARFDGGVPSRESEHYWLYLLGTTPIFIPIVGIWIFLGIAFGSAIVALVVVRRRDELPTAPGRVRWSGIKAWLFSLIIVACGWYSSHIVGSLRGLRHPWLTAINAYYVLALLAMVIGGWVVLHLARRMRLAQSPWRFAIRSLIFLLMFEILFCLLSVKLTVEPAMAMLLISLALISRRPWLKAFFLILSPWWMLRLLFSEWDQFVFRSIGNLAPATTTASIIIDGFLPLIFSISLVPFLYASIAVLRTSPELKAFVLSLRSPRVLASSAIAFIALVGYLMSIPVYDELWYREIRVNEEFNMDEYSSSIQIKSTEYLSGLNIKYGGRDTLIHDRTTVVDISPVGVFDTSWVTIERKDTIEHLTDSLTHHRVGLAIATTRRPYTIAISYSRGQKVIPGFDTPYKSYAAKSGETKIEWYSFPDTMLNVPVEFSVPAGDSVKETIEVTFVELAYPMKYDADHAYFIPRTTFKREFIYRRQEPVATTVQNLLPHCRSKLSSLPSTPRTALHTDT